MNISSLSDSDLQSRLNKGLNFRLGDFSVRLTSSIRAITIHLSKLYASYEILDEDVFVDFHIKLYSPSLFRRYFRPQVNFSFDGQVPFKPLPFSQASAMFEWGLNWCIANHSNQFLIMHAAVVELNGQAFIFPGAPGSGKSTLCAALVSQGWRLLSDEMTLVSIEDGSIHPVPRPISLKNQSIKVIQNFSKDAIFGQVVEDTAKGTIAHMRSPDTSIYTTDKRAIPAKLIFPKYKQGSKTELISLSKANSVLKAAKQCFNYSVLGVQGFESLCGLVDQSECYEFSYSRLDDAIPLFKELAS